MSAILTTTVSIVAITCAVWALRFWLRIALCPICLGVGGTWLWMVVARSFGYPVDTTMLAILMGGSVAGTAYLVEKRLPPMRSALLWKTLFMPLGFVAAYALAMGHWTVLAVVVGALILLTAVFLRSPGAAPQNTEKVDDLTRKMKDCC